MRSNTIKMFINKKLKKKGNENFEKLNGLCLESSVKIAWKIPGGTCAISPVYEEDGLTRDRVSQTRTLISGSIASKGRKFLAV